jgi:hypothetical protein
MTATSLELRGQRLTQESDTALSVFVGKQIVSQQKQGDTLLREGKYIFRSQPYKSITHKGFRITELNVFGNNHQNLPDGEWKINFQHYDIEEPVILRGKQMRFGHTLNGRNEIYAVNWVQGKYKGTFEYRRREIAAGVLQKEVIPVSIVFENDTLKGAFHIDFEHVKITGETDSDGFLDGYLCLEYQQDSLLVAETRSYTNGFLTNLLKTNRQTGDTLANIVFMEVLQRLQSLRLKKEGNNHKISNEWFGIDFNAGYSEDSPKMTNQRAANLILMQNLAFCDSLYSLLDSSYKHKTIFKLTRRFEYAYPEYEDSLIAELQPKTKKLQEDMQAILQRPNLLLRKQTSDSLAFQMAKIEGLLIYAQAINAVFDNIENGYFKYKSRNRFYENGVPSLNQAVDTIYFKQQGEPLMTTVRLKNPVVKPDSLLYQFQAVEADLRTQFNRIADNIANLLTNYENQEQIDSLDMAIAKHNQSLKELFPPLEESTGKDNQQVPFAYKLSSSIEENHLAPLSTKYLKNSLSQVETIELGKQILCFQDFLTQNRAYLDTIGIYKKLWDERLFTLYRENPFDFRKFETKILGGTQSAVNILHSYYGTQMLNAKDCEQLIASLQKIRKLNERVRFLTKNHEQTNVQQLDRALRRERVPIRIERLLEL